MFCFFVAGIPDGQLAFVCLQHRKVSRLITGQKAIQPTWDTRSLRQKELPWSWTPKMGSERASGWTRTEIGGKNLLVASKQSQVPHHPKHQLVHMVEELGVWLVAVWVMFSWSVFYPVVKYFVCKNLSKKNSFLETWERDFFSPPVTEFAFHKVKVKSTWYYSAWSGCKSVLCVWTSYWASFDSEYLNWDWTGVFLNPDELQSAEFKILMVETSGSDRTTRS